jgi:hypothetical protein
LISKTSTDTAPRSRDAWRPSGCRNAPPRKIKRAQGRPGAGRNPWPACRKKCRRQSPQVQPNHPAFPARWCYSFLRALPGDHCLVATVAGEIAPAGLAPASERQNHTTSPSASASFVRTTSARRRHSRPPHPAPTFRDDRP